MRYLDCAGVTCKAKDEVPHGEHALWGPNGPGADGGNTCVNTQRQEARALMLRRGEEVPHVRGHKVPYNMAHKRNKRAQERSDSDCAKPEMRAVHGANPVRNADGGGELKVNEKF